MIKSLLTIYVLLLGLALGVEIAAGAFVAPVIFHPERYLGADVLTHFQSGILMTQVFLKTNILLSVVALYSIVYELMAWIKKEHDNFALVLSLCTLILTSLFIFYYTTFIVDAQLLGPQATMTAEFAKMHQESEWVIKILMMVQSVLLFRKMGKKQKV
ncbi:MAG: DUF4149 domain-containing protein [Sulfurospirillaceae bacterium]|nr:DUF4149 domain-containing protein [Sulfurospirillaceae bacterium]MDD2825802.1 DUF4149 domain-containing protein [Sulfurospirillaceae bacterium]